MTQLSGGEKARLMMGLAAFDAPHLLILDEPTNHLDIDSRSALIEAINDYEGAIILISHDRFLIDACADRLWLVDSGTVKSFDGDMEDYKALVLSKASGAAPGKRVTKGEVGAQKPIVQDNRISPGKAANLAKKQIIALDEKIKKLSGLITRIDAALVDPNAYSRDKGKATQLAQQRKDLQRALDAAEDEWLSLTTALDAAEYARARWSVPSTRARCARLRTGQSRGGTGAGSPPRTRGPLDERDGAFDAARQRDLVPQGRGALAVARRIEQRAERVRHAGGRQLPSGDHEPGAGSRYSGRGRALLEGQRHDDQRDAGRQSVEHGIEPAMRHDSRGGPDHGPLRHESFDPWVAGERGRLGGVELAAMRDGERQSTIAAGLRHDPEDRQAAALQGAERAEDVGSLVAPRPVASLRPPQRAALHESRDSALLRGKSNLRPFG